MIESDHNKPIILVFIRYYLPGYRAGGPVKTVSNLVQLLGDDFLFKIVTLDRDLGDEVAYEGLERNIWTAKGKAQVMYVSEQEFGFSGLKRIAMSTRHDIVYLNSFFDSKFSIYVVICQLLRLMPKKPIVLAPRGEFSPSALKLKFLKKFIFLNFFGRIYRCVDILFQASSEFEAGDICSTLGVESGRVAVAIDLPQVANLSANFLGESSKNRDNFCGLDIIFLSRVSPMKNLDFALNCLLSVTCEVRFHIYGPIEDEKYWEQCLRIIKRLPKNVNVSYFGSVPAERVSDLISSYDVFFLPSRGENYGHAIVEAISVGTPVLISDRTPWRNLCDGGFGWDLPLNSYAGFARIIDEFSKLDSDARLRIRSNMLMKKDELFGVANAVQANRNMFMSTCER